MKKIKTYVVFENEICSIGSVLDGQSLNELIHFDESSGDLQSFYLDAVPRVGETVELRSSAGSHWFSVLGVHHSIHADSFHCVKLLLRQIPLDKITSDNWIK